MLIQDGSASSPSYQVGLSDPYFTLSPTSPASITFYPRPVFIANQLAIQRNGTALVASAELSVGDNYPDSQVTFTVQTAHGQFEFISSSGNQSTTQFTQQQLKAGQVQFRHDGSISAPSYNVTISDPYFTVGSVTGSVNYQFIPFPPQVIHPLLPRIFSPGQTFEFNVPIDTFLDMNDETLTLSAALSDGEVLPAGINFNSPTATFSGVINQPAQWNISLTAKDCLNYPPQRIFYYRLRAHRPLQGVLISRP